MTRFWKKCTFSESASPAKATKASQSQIPELLIPNPLIPYEINP